MIRRSAARVVDLAQQLEARSSLLMLLQLPDTGRGLIAAQDIPYGTHIHNELPMLATPSASAFDSTCSSCLKPLPIPGHPAAAPHNSRNQYTFCSSDCQSDAEETWLHVASSCDFSALRNGCQEAGEKFPLMAAKLACMELQREEERKPLEYGNREGRAQAENVDLGLALRGDPIRDLRHLCFANIPQPPPEWSHMHSLLLQGLRSSKKLSSSTLDLFTLDWYCWVLSRLHLNIFRVDTMPPMELTDPSALLKAAAAAVGGGAAPTSPQGSAVYLLGSMFNHSCEPNVDITFPENNAEISFVAAMDIPKHTELTVSYIDGGAARAVRQEQLRFAYGFRCQCPKCVEEAEMGVNNRV